jgi:hypothetical protein
MIHRKIKEWHAMSTMFALKGKTERAGILSVPVSPGCHDELLSSTTSSPP